jgi:hypothetical protein
MIKALGTGLRGTRQALAVDVLTKAALDPGSGAFTRGLLYSWAASAAQRQLVVAVCGGQWGVEKPDIALTRLWRAVERRLRRRAAEGRLAANHHRPLR